MLPLLTDLTVTHLSKRQAVTRDGENTLAKHTCTSINAGGGDAKNVFVLSVKYNFLMESSTNQKNK